VTHTKRCPDRSASLAGYLWKMKKKYQFHLPQWNKRWFSIEGKYLKWYAREDSAEMSGQISLLDIKSINRFESGGGVYSFIIYSRERSLFLRADSARTMEMWFRAVQMHADLARGGNGSTLLSDSSLSATPSSTRTRKRNTLCDELERASRALDELERASRAEENLENVQAPETETIEALTGIPDSCCLTETSWDEEQHTSRYTKSALTTGSLEDSLDSTDSCDMVFPIRIRRPTSRSGTSEPHMTRNNNQTQPLKCFPKPEKFDRATVTHSSRIDVKTKKRCAWE